MADFATWQRENLERLATELTERVKQLEEAVAEQYQIIAVQTLEIEDLQRRLDLTEH